MRVSCGCLVEDGMVLHGYDGPCGMPTEPEPTAEDYCASDGHQPHYDDGNCYCGHRAETEQVRCSTCGQFAGSLLGKMPGHVYGSNWPWVPCQTCGGSGYVPAGGED